MWAEPVAPGGLRDRPRGGKGKEAKQEEVCWRFNSGSCPDGKFCHRRHVCLICGGRHPQTQCHTLSKEERAALAPQPKPAGGKTGKKGGKKGKGNKY